MKSSDNILSIKELEKLCQLYMEGKLSVKEEKYLSLILPSSSDRSAIIEETLFLMGIGKIASKNNLPEDTSHQAAVTGNKTDSPNKNAFRKSVLKIFSASTCAAAVIAVLTFGWNLFSKDFTRDEDTVFTAYVDGKEENDPQKAKLIALAEYERGKQFFEKMHAIQEKELKEAKQLTGIYDKALSGASELTSKTL